MAVLLFGPLLGILAGFLAACLAMGPAWLRGNDSPGGGFVPIVGAALGLLLALVPTVALALRILLRSPNPDSYQGTASAVPPAANKESGL